MQFAATPLSVSRKQVATQPVTQSMTFAQAFRHARANGLKVFNWNGRSYNTNLAQDSIEAAVPKETIVNSEKIAPSVVVANVPDTLSVNGGEIAPSIVYAAAPDTLSINGEEIAPATISANRINPNKFVVDTSGFVANRPSIGQKEKPWNFWDVILARR